MIHIDNLKEKELLIAHYFCGKSRKELNPHEVFDMWSNWFKRDFRVKGKPRFCVVDDQLVYRKSAKMSDEKIRKKYNYAFQKIYKWIKQTLEVEDHDKIFFKKELEKERNREYGKVIRLAKPLGFYLAMSKSFSGLAQFKILNYGEKGHIITSGDCDKMIKYLQEMKA